MFSYLVTRNGENVQMYFANSHEEAIDFAMDIDGFPVNLIRAADDDEYDFIMEVL